MNIVCSICARGGSKGFPGKNVRQLKGKPLIAWSIDQAKHCVEIDKIFISTDSSEIAGVAKEYGALVPFTRPPELSDDNVGKWEVWQHAIKTYEEFTGEVVDILVDLDCTSPLREPSDISLAIKKFQVSKVDAVFSICEARKNPYFNLIEESSNGLVISKVLADRVVRRQDAPKVFEHVASIYVLSRDYLMTGTGLLSGKTAGYDIGQPKSLDVDSEFDFKLIEFLMNDRTI
ncbi:acylneuraminate cytidylyltransferase family protein [Gammaproteobacteria bacterium]|nr:acylneuraminate cytidylyltransferase family protein [Gammaproteobacteria bacterium]